MRYGSLLVRSICLAVWVMGAFAQQSVSRPRLVLHITVDQLRGDLPLRYFDRFGEGGFRYLYESGVVFANAHHRHANTETIVGHATLATGADPAVHGMVANVWFDRETGRLTYNVEDDRYPLLTGSGGVNQETEVDPTQKVAGTDGRSPSAILTSTAGDELALQTRGRAQVFGVSVKDRGAISMAGHAGKAFWFSKAAGEFVTSSYYYDRYPDWVTRWNQTRPAERYGGTSWELLQEQGSYQFGEADDQEWETDFPGYGRTFPHPYGPADGPYFTMLLTVSPAGDQLTLDFAKALIENEELGKDQVPDYLAVSFSSTDYIGHTFGPSSLESEDNLLRLDLVLADLFDFVDEQIGLDNTLIVLSADHGAAEAPGYLNSLGIPAAYIEPEKWDGETAIDALKKRFGLGEELIDTFSQPYVYLNHDAIEENGLNLAEVERAVAAELMRFDGIALAVSSSALRDGNAPDTAVIRSVLHNFNPKRSGDIYVVFEPHYFVNDFDGLTVTSSHGSPWSYDTFVPVVFAGAGLEHQQVYRRVHTVDVAPTISAALGIKSPSGATGALLVEALR